MLCFVEEIVSKLRQIIVMVARIDAVFEQDRVTTDVGRREVVCDLLLLQYFHHGFQALVHRVVHLSIDDSFVAVEKSAKTPTIIEVLSSGELETPRG